MDPKKEKTAYTGNEAVNSSSNLDILTQSPLFQKIQPSEVKSMMGCLGAYARGFEKGAYLTLEGENLRYIGVVLRGFVHMLKEDIWGSHVIYSVIKPGDVFGETFVCGGIPRTTVSFMAAEDSEILFLGFERILNTCSSSCVFHNRLIENMVTVIAHKNAALMEKLEVTSKKTIRERILSYLSQESQRNRSSYFTVPLGRTELANYLCVDRSALSRELAHMKAEKLLDFDGNTFRIL